jgi:competence protein ComEC
MGPDKKEPVFLRPLIPMALGMMVGIGLGLHRPGLFWPVMVFVLIVAGAIGGYAWRGRSLLLMPLMLCAAVGYLSVQPWLRSDLPGGHVGRYTEQGKWLVSGIVIDQPRMQEGQQRFTIEARRLMQGTRRIEARGKIRVTARGRSPALERGCQVLLIGRLRAIHGFSNFGGFDYERYMALRGVHANLSTVAGHIRLEKPAARAWPARLDRWRDDLRRQMQITLQGHRPVVVNLLTALTLGDREAIDPDLRERFQRVGVSHVLAISGLHIGMVATAAFALMYRLLVWIPVLPRNAWVRKSAALITIVPVVGYGVLAGFTPSTQRAVLMVLVLLATFWVGRPPNWLNVLALAAVLILLVFPPALAQVSFQLSFSAVLAIVLGLQAMPLPRPDPQAPLWRRIGARLVALMGVSSLAILGTLPLAMYYFNQVSWVGPLTNLVVVPLVGMMVVPAGLLGIVCAPISGTLAALPWQLAAFAMSGGLQFVDWVARYPFVAVDTVTPSLVEMGVIYLLFGVCLTWKRRSIRTYGLVVVLVVSGIDAAYWYQRRFGTRQMIVTAVDIGQGSANLLRLPGGFTVLVDGGGFSDNVAFDVGRQVLAPLLLREKIKTIDLMILTHPDSDHLNGLLHILRHFRVKEVWSNHEAANRASYRQWQQLIAQRQIPHVPFVGRDRLATYHGVTFEILAPPEDFLQRGIVETWRNANNNSLVVRVNWNALSLLFTGDIGAPAEAELVEEHGAEGLRSTILFVPHHGSGSSSTSGFLQAVQPREGIIGLGWQNRFGFPAQAVARRLSAEGIRIWRTDQCGAIRIVMDANGYYIQTSRAGSRTSMHRLPDPESRAGK